MARSVVGRLLIAGENHKELADKFSADIEVEPYIKYRFSDRAKLHELHLKRLEGILTLDTIKLTQNQYETYRRLYQDALDMDDEEFYEFITFGYELDENTNDAYTTTNPTGYYRYPKCYQERLKRTGEEADFIDPFKLKDGTTSYIARMGEIDWTNMHMANKEIYEAAWEICVDGRNPKTDIEKTIQENMGNRHDYFANFKNKEQYVAHSCSFWTNAFIDRDGQYHEMSFREKDVDWTSKFYGRFIENLPEDILLSLYEIRSVKD